MINAIPLIGWFLSVFFSAAMAVPFWLIWTVGGYGRTYAYWLPEVYLTVGFWDCVWIFIAASILKAVFLPRFAGSNTNNSK